MRVLEAGVGAGRPEIDLGTHSVRHSQVALLIAHGEHPKVIADRLEHSSVRTNGRRSGFDDSRYTASERALRRPTQLEPTRRHQPLLKSEEPHIRSGRGRSSGGAVPFCSSVSCRRTRSGDGCSFGSTPPVSRLSRRRVVEPTSPARPPRTFGRAGPPCGEAGPINRADRPERNRRTCTGGTRCPGRSSRRACRRGRGSG